MAFKNDIQVIIQDGGLGRLATGKDFYTGIIFQSTTVPAGYGSDVIKRIYTLKQAEALGITVADYPVANYQISEYFRLLEKWNFNGLLDVMFSNIALGDFDGSEIETIQRNADGELQQVGVFLIDSYADGFVTAANTIAGNMDAIGYPLSLILSADIADMDAVSDARTLSSKWVTPLVAMDGNATGYALFQDLGYSVCNLGAALAATAYAKVNENVGWVEKFDISGATEMQTLALADGDMVKDLSEAQIDVINDKGYMLAVKRKVSGSYFYDAPTATVLTSDFAYMQENRTIGKAKRLILQYMAKHQNRPLFVDPTTGYMTEQTISLFDTTVREALQTMIVAQEIPADPNTGRLADAAVSINPEQNVLSTSKLIINVKIGATGVARSIEIPLGFGTA
jgi:hypothetical protein